MKKLQLLLSLIGLLALLQSCTPTAPEATGPAPCEEYLDFSSRDDQFTGGIKMVPINTPSGEFKVWTKRVGNNPRMKVLLLHGGPGGTHEFFECFEGYLPQEGIEFIYYDQLGSFYSDQPSDTTLWTNERFVEEVEQVRQALGLDNTNFYLYGQSWGGILAMEYAKKYQQHLKGLIISNMMADITAYSDYAHEVLGPAMDPEVYAEILEIEKNEDFQNPRYMELLNEHHYAEHILRMPLDEWPNSVQRAFEHFNNEVYIYMQGYSEFGITKGATLEGWDVTADLPNITVPTLTIGATYDSMDPKHMEWMATQFPNARFHLCPDGGHLCQYDDQKAFFEGLISFVKDVDSGAFGK